MSEMAANDNWERYRRILVSEENDEAAGQVSPVPPEEISAASPQPSKGTGTGYESSTYQGSGTGYHRRRGGYYEPSDDVWMDTSWATMSPQRMRGNPVWSPAITADSANERYSTAEYSYTNQRHSPTEYLFSSDPQSRAEDGTDIYDRSPGSFGGRRTDGRGRGAVIILALALLGLLAAAAIFGHMKTESNAEAYIEEYMDR